MLKTSKKRRSNNKFFEHLKRLTSTKQPFDKNDSEDIAGYDPFMINRYISMCNAYLMLVNEINHFDLPKHVHYKYYHACLPQKYVFFDYIKKKKDVNIEKKKLIAKYFNVGLKEVEQYVLILTNEQIKEICSKYNYGVKKAK